MNRTSDSFTSAQLSLLALATLALLGLRLFEFGFSGAGLHVDEAQYWLWSNNLDWGYFPKSALAMVAPWMPSRPVLEPT